MVTRRDMIGLAAAGLAGTALESSGSITRSALALRGAMMGGGKKGPTARDYVQDGLIAMWDGIENAGWGVHDDGATVWKDLVGGVELIPVGDLIWGESSPVFDDKLYFNVGPGFSLDGGDMTSECVALSYGGKGNQGILGFGSAFKRFLWLYFGTASTYSTSTLNYQYRGSTSYVHRNEGSLAERFSATCVCADGLINSYKFGRLVELTKDVRAGSIAFEYGDNYIGYISGYNKMSGQINCIRIYNRALSSSEIAANYAVDKARFNI